MKHKIPFGALQGSHTPCSIFSAASGGNKIYLLQIGVIERNCFVLKSDCYLCLKSTFSTEL
jgi:hypothetical protein